MEPPIEITDDEYTNFSFVGGSSLLEDLTCAKCAKVFSDPQMLWPCGDVLCSQCLPSSNTATTCCPLCSSQIQSLKPIPNILSNLLGKLKVKCKTCHQELPRKDASEHYWHMCEISCPYGCGATMFRSQLPAHENDECSVNPIKCTAEDVGCRILCTQQVFQQHHEICPYVQLRPILKDMQNQISTLKTFVAAYSMKKGWVRFNLQSVSEDVIINILEFLNAADLYKLNRVSRMWRQFSNHETLWQRLCRSIGGLESNPEGGTWKSLYPKIGFLWDADHITAQNIPDFEVSNMGRTLRCTTTNNSRWRTARVNRPCKPNGVTTCGVHIDVAKNSISYFVIGITHESYDFSSTSNQCSMEVSGCVLTDQDNGITIGLEVDQINKTFTYYRQKPGTKEYPKTIVSNLKAGNYYFSASMVSLDQVTIIPTYALPQEIQCQFSK